MLVFFIVIGVCVVFFFSKEAIPFVRKGYSKEEIEILNILTKEQREEILSQKYIDILPKLVVIDGYDKRYLWNYIIYYLDHKSLSLTEIVSEVNSKQVLAPQEKDDTKAYLFTSVDGYQSDRVDRYIDYYNKNNGIDISSVVLLVNADVDLQNVNYEDFLVQLVQAPYFISSYVERYLNYYHMFGFEADLVVAYVNSNLDYDYYTNTQDANLSLDTLILVNKYYKLASDYIPDDLVTIESAYGHYEIRSVVYPHLKEMIDAARMEGMNLYAASPFRSYQTQSGLYEGYASSDGYANADRYSARPGYSEHQTGLAIDFVTPGGSLGSFESSMEFGWMQENCYKYGFVLRYPYGKEAITGYMYEPWHYRYVGKEVATQIYNEGITYEEYYAYYVNR